VPGGEPSGGQPRITGMPELHDGRGQRKPSSTDIRLEAATHATTSTAPARRNDRAACAAS
jgi:hypothetical protein